MLNAEKYSGEATEDNVVDGGNMGDIKAGLGDACSVLCQPCPGEAMTLLTGVQDCQRFSAWPRLRRRFNPRTVPTYVKGCQS